MSWRHQAVSIGDATAPGTGESRLLAVGGPIDHGAVLDLERQLEAARSVSAGLVVIDALGADLTDPGPFSKLCAVLRTSARDARLVILTVDSRVRWVIELCQIDGLELHSSIESAVRRRNITSGERTRAASARVRSPFR